MNPTLPDKYQPGMDFFVNHMPGYVLIKNMQSQILKMNSLTAKFLFDSTNPFEMVGATDFDMKNELVYLAEEFVREDRILQNKRKPVQILHGFIMDDAPVFHLYNKSLITDEGIDIAIMIHTYGIYNENIINNFLELGKQDSKRYGLRNDGRLVNYSLCDEYEELKLSDRQAECLFYLLRGKSASMIGKICKISTRTVETYIEQLKNKMGCQNKSELIEKAVNLGYTNVVPKRVFNL